MLTAGLGPAAPELGAGPRDMVPGSGRQEVVEVELQDSCRFGSFSASSLVSTTMSRQLPTLRGRRGRGLFRTDSPSTETPNSLFLFVPPEAFRRADLDEDKPHDARLSEEEKSFCLLRLEESSRMVSMEQLLV